MGSNTPSVRDEVDATPIANHNNPLESPDQPVEESVDLRGRFGIWFLAIANGVSQIGNSITALAIPWFVLATTGSASRTGVAGAVVAFSPVLAGIVSGPIVDRLGFRRSSIISDALSGITVLLIPVLYLFDWLTFGQLLVLIFLGAFFDVPGHTARSALVPPLARRASMQLERANSVLQLSVGLSDAVIAPLLAGVLITALGAAQVLFLDAGTFAVSILIVGLLIAKPSQPTAGSNGSSPQDEEIASTAINNLLAGFRFVVRDVVLQTLLPVAILLNFIGRAYGGVILPVYVRDEYNNPAYFGLIISAMGIGMLTGILLFGAYGYRFRRYDTLLVGFTLNTVAIWLFTMPSLSPDRSAGDVPLRARHRPGQSDAQHPGSDSNTRADARTSVERDLHPLHDRRPTWCADGRFRHRRIRAACHHDRHRRPVYHRASLVRSQPLVPQRRSCV